MRKACIRMAAGLCLAAVLTGRAEEMERTISVSLSAPDAAWRLKIEKVVRVGDELYAVAILSRHPGMAAQVIRTARDAVTVRAPKNLPVRVFVIGKTWKWENHEDYTFVESMEQVGPKLKSGTVVYERPDQPEKEQPAR